jgi:hypothetical protein
MAFTIHAYREDCPYSTKVLKYFYENTYPNCKIITYDKYDKDDRPPNHPKISTMPRIFYDEHLVADCESWFKLIQYIKTKWNNSHEWTNDDTDKTCKLLLKGVQRRVACSVVLAVLKGKFV